MSLNPIKGSRCLIKQEISQIAKYGLVIGTDSSVISQSNYVN